MVRAMKYEIDKLDIVKQIGQGSFSNVYLCKNDVMEIENSQQLIFEAENIREMYYIVKEININILVRKYLDQNKAKNKKIIVTKKNDSPVNPNITPFSRREYTISLENNENDYYYCRLKDLIESEVDVMKFIEHNNIVKFYDSTNKDGVYYLYMEYCDEGDVYNLLKKRDYNRQIRNTMNGFSNSFVYNFIKQVIDGFVYIHGKHIIHRDIKLHNILVKKTNSMHITFKISDFGFACYDLTTIEESAVEEALGKKYFKLCGTPYYMAPEIILNMHMLENFTKYTKPGPEKNLLFYNSKVDIWSFGVCVYELITNSLPFPEIKGLRDLEMFYKGTAINMTAQNYIDKKIDSARVMDPIIRRLLKLILKVDPKERLSAVEVKEYVKKYQTPILDINSNGQTKRSMQEELADEINNYENVYKNENSNNLLKQHIVSNPIDSWEKINRSSSIILNMSIEKGFLNWLRSKK